VEGAWDARSAWSGWGRVASGVVVAGFTIFLVAWIIGAGVGTVVDLVARVVSMAVAALPWVIAARLLWRAWWRRTGAGLAALDGPARLLAVSAAALPEDRRDWGAAMAAELAQVLEREARWRFALSSARAASFPPRGSWRPVLVAGGLTAAVTLVAALAAGAAPATRCSR
jgi:hypothetical protein